MSTPQSPLVDRLKEAVEQPEVMAELESLGIAQNDVQALVMLLEGIPLPKAQRPKKPRRVSAKELAWKIRHARGSRSQAALRFAAKAHDLYLELFLNLEPMPKWFWRPSEDFRHGLGDALGPALGIDPKASQPSSSLKRLLAMVQL